jgi:uncharacterized integral membrane protein (TIGR00698 family)
MLLAHLPSLQDWGFSALTLAIVAGLLAGNAFPLPATLLSGITLAKGPCLRLGIVLYGLRITFQQIAHIGPAGILTDALVLSSTFALACLAGPRWLGLDRQTAILIGAGSSICGAAAIMATHPLLKAEPGKVAVAIATVVLFGTFSMFLYPVLFALNAHGNGLLSPQGFAIYTGATVHEVAQVVAAGHAMGEDIGTTALITKMIRVMMLAPFLLALSFTIRDKKGTHPTRISIPWFALCFIAAAAINSTGIIPHALGHQLETLDTLLLATAMAALGLDTRLHSIREAGVRPLLLAALLFAHLLLTGSLITFAVQFWLS